MEKYKCENIKKASSLVREVSQSVMNSRTQKQKGFKLQRW